MSGVSARTAPQPTAAIANEINGRLFVGKSRTVSGTVANKALARTSVAYPISSTTAAAAAIGISPPRQPVVSNDPGRRDERPKHLRVLEHDHLPAEQQR